MSSIPFLNSPLLPLLLMCLSRQRFSPITQQHFLPEYDYVIVGAGSAGATLAGRLSEIPCVNVLLLEAGGHPSIFSEVPALGNGVVDMDDGWEFKTVPQKYAGNAFINNQVTFKLAKILGGCSTVNGLVCSRGNRKNYDQWAAQGAKGWSYEEVLPYFKKLEDNEDYDVLFNGYHNSGGPISMKRANYHTELKNLIAEAAVSMGYKFVDSNGPTQYGFYNVQSNIIDGQRCSTAKAYLVPNDSRANLNIVTNATVTKILIESHRAVGVEFELNGMKQQVRARKEVILSAGAFNTPHLLMLSGIGPREQLEKFGIPVIADLPVGQNLMDHISFSVFFDLGNFTEARPEKLTNDANILDYILYRKGPLSSTGVLLVSYLSGKSDAELLDEPEYGTTIFEANDMYFNSWNLQTEIKKKLMKRLKGKALLGCGFFLLNPKSRGTVRLASSHPHDAPSIDPNYYQHPDDVKLMIQGVNSCKKLLENPIIARTGGKLVDLGYPECEELAHDPDLHLECEIRSVPDQRLHFCGTAKMGGDADPTAVVNPELKVKSIQNLRVVDASVMPTIIWGNTNIPTIMIAEKAADIIKSSIHC